jgi:hypothetical protein
MFARHEATPAAPFTCAERSIFKSGRANVSRLTRLGPGTIKAKRQKSLGGTNRETVSCPAIFEKTSLNVLSGTAPGHTVVWVGLLASLCGTEKKYCDRGKEAIPSIVAHGVLYDELPVSEVQPVVSEP